MEREASEAEVIRRLERRLPFVREVRRLLQMPLACFGFAVILLVVVSAIFAPQIAPHDPLKQYTGHYLEPPSSMFPLGTPIGLVSGYSRGWLDEVIMRIMDALVAFPSLIIAVGIIAAMGSSLANVIIALGTANIPWMARVVRSQALSVRERDFVMAARSVRARLIIRRHIWPNCTAPVIVQTTLGMAYAILAEVALGFIGVGVPPPTPTWGNMLQFAFPLLGRAPLLSIIPGLAIFLTVLGFNFVFVGDALRDLLDPRLRGLFR